MTTRAASTIDAAFVAAVLWEFDLDAHSLDVQDSGRCWLDCRHDKALVYEMTLTRRIGFAVYAMHRMSATTSRLYFRVRGVGT